MESRTKQDKTGLTKFEDWESVQNLEVRPICVWGLWESLFFWSEAIIKLTINIMSNIRIQWIHLELVSKSSVISPINYQKIAYSSILWWWCWWCGRNVRSSLAPIFLQKKFFWNDNNGTISNVGRFLANSQARIRLISEIIFFLYIFVIPEDPDL